jgi:large subunit ribosomal protein L30
VEKSSETIHVQWVRSGIGFTYKQRQIVRSLGLRRLQQVKELPDTASVRGSVACVAHLVQIIQPVAQPGWLSTPEYSIHAAELLPKTPAVVSAADERVEEVLPSLGVPEAPSSEALPKAEVHDSGEPSAAGRSQE